MDSTKFKAYQMFFRTLANNTRLKIVSALHPKPLNVTQICQRTGFEQTLVSHNLKMLEYHGMVFVEKQGKYKYYTLNKETIKPLLQLLDKHTKEYCCQILGGKR